MKPKDVTPQLIERLTLDGMETFCRLVWQIASERVKKEYPRFAMSDKDFHDFFEKCAYDAESRVGFKMAYELFPHVMSSRPSRVNAKIEKSGEIDNMLEEMSLTICRLGGQGSMSDVKYYFRRDLEREKETAAQIEQYARQDPPPKWAVQQAKEALARARRLKELKAPDFIVEDAFNRWGGEGKMSLTERAALNLRGRVEYWRKSVAKLEDILANLENGNRTPAVLHISNILEVSVDEYSEAREESTNWKTGKTKKKSGNLSVFMRKSKGNLTLDKEVVESDFHLCQSLLQILQPTSGRA